MVNLSSLRPVPGSNRERKRVGRGPGSGTGSQSGAGHKGQKARSGFKTKFWFEGGQMPLARRLPKRGFTNKFKKVFQVVNVGLLGKLQVDVIDREILVRSRLVRSKRLPLKVLGNGELDRPMHVKAEAFSKAAIAKIEKAGGKVQVVA